MSGAERRKGGLKNLYFFESKVLGIEIFEHFGGLKTEIWIKFRL